MVSPRKSRYILPNASPHCQREILVMPKTLVFPPPKDTREFHDESSQMSPNNADCCFSAFAVCSLAAFARQAQSANSKAEHNAKLRFWIPTQSACPTYVRTKRPAYYIHEGNLSLLKPQTALPTLPSSTSRKHHRQSKGNEQAVI